jgi:bifunctional non-homologous end joining protein LigD
MQRLSAKTRTIAKVGAQEVALTSLDKVYWPEQGYAKRDLVDYYASMASYILPHLKDRPLSLVRYPEGIKSEGFYQKDAPSGMPAWVNLAPIMSKEKGSYINFILCQNVETLVWMANSGAIEVNPWLSRYRTLDNPDFAVFDIDPSEGTGWEDVKKVAKLVKSLLDEWKLEGYPKVSGATGLHIYVPILPKYSYKDVSKFVGLGASLIRGAFPDLVTLERKVKDRTGLVYIDYPQNARGQTISAVYGVRASNGAPVSMPVTWDELGEDSPVHTRSWNIKTALERARSVGDIFAPVLTSPQDIDHCLRLSPPG